MKATGPDDFLLFLVRVIRLSDDDDDVAALRFAGGFLLGGSWCWFIVDSAALVGMTLFGSAWEAWGKKSMLANKLLCSFA